MERYNRACLSKLLFAISLWETTFHLLMGATLSEGGKFANITGKLSCSRSGKKQPLHDGHMDML